MSQGNEPIAMDEEEEETEEESEQAQMDEEEEETEEESEQAQKLRKCMEQKIAELNAFKINFTRPEDQLTATGNAQQRLENQRLDRMAAMSKKRSVTGEERVKEKVKRKERERGSKRNQMLANKRLKRGGGAFGFGGGKRKTRKRKTRKRKTRKRKTRKRKTRKRNKRVKRRKKTRKRRR